jgi:hypothetical protein
MAIESKGRGSGMNRAVGAVVTQTMGGILAAEIMAVCLSPGEYKRH